MPRSAVNVIEILHGVVVIKRNNVKLADGSNDLIM